jgi:hypothetical protein
MSTLQQTLALLQGGVSTESEKLREMINAPINRKFVNPGQGGMDALLRPDQNQNRALLAASLEMMGHNPTTMPGETMSRGIGKGFELLDSLRAQDREQGLSGQALALEQARDDREFGTSLMAQKTPASIQEYQFAVSQGYKGSYDQFLRDKKGPGINVNTGTIPPGYQMIYNAQGQPERMEAIPGGPAAQEAADAARQTAQSQSNQARTTGVLLRDARTVVEGLDGLPESGTARLVQSKIPDTASYQVQSAIKSLKGTIAIEQLLNIKREGSGLGQVPQSQLDMLSTLMGELDIALPKERMKSLINDIQEIYAEVLSRIPEDELERIGIASREYGALRDGSPGGGVDPSLLDGLDLTDEQKRMVMEALQ